MMKARLIDSGNVASRICGFRHTRQRPLRTTRITCAATRRVEDEDTQLHRLAEVDRRAALIAAASLLLLPCWGVASV